MVGRDPPIPRPIPMLQERFEPDERFWALIDELALEMDPILAHIDEVLDDEVLFQRVKADLTRRYPKTLETGRPSLPVETIVRMLALRHLYVWSYRETIRYVNDSLVLRGFARLYFEPAPEHTTLNRWALLIQPKTLHDFNARLVELATQEKVTRGRKLRTDGTVVETPIAYPSDSKLLADGIRVISRTIQRAKGFLKDLVARSKKTFRDRRRSARRQARRIANAARRHSAAAQADLARGYRRLLDVSRGMLRQAEAVLAGLKQQPEPGAQRLSRTLEQFMPRLQQALWQTKRRVFEAEAVPSAQKIVSLFEPHTQIIRRKRAGKETEFGHKVWLDEVDGGIVTRWEVLSGNASDAAQWQPSLDQHLAQFGRAPRQASADRGVYSPQNEQYAQAQGVKRVILPKPGRKSAARARHERTSWFRRGRRFHAGIEGRINVLKHCHGLARCRDHGAAGFDKWVGWGVIAGNLAVLGRVLTARAA